MNKLQLKQIKKERATKLVVITILVVVAMLLFRNINYFAVPESDFFQFLNNAKIYRQFRLPSTLHAPPANPLLIALLGNIIDIPRSELFVAIASNIIFFCLSMFLLFQIAKQYLGLWTFFPLALMLSNPISYYVSLQPVSETLFTLCVLIVVYLRQRGKLHLAYIVAGLSMLVRYEALALFTAMAGIDFVSVKDKKASRRALLLGAFPIVVLAMIVNWQNESHTLLGNPFIQEIVEVTDELPNNKIFDMQPFFLFIHNNKPINSQVAFTYYLYAFIGMSFFYIKKQNQLMTISLFALGYLTIHWLFPFYADRYSYPIMWIVYLVGLWPFWLMNKEHKEFSPVLPVLAVFVIASTVYVLLTNIDILPEYLAWNKYSRFENRMVADWLTQSAFPRKTLVLTFEPWIMSYFTHNRNINFAKMGPFGILDCKTVSCIMSNEEVNVQNTDVIFVVDNAEFDKRIDPWTSQHGIEIFRNFERSEDFNDFEVIARLEEHEKWAKIYKYQPEKPI